jgi:hypothetical protein
MNNDAGELPVFHFVLYLFAAASLIGPLWVLEMGTAFGGLSVGYFDSFLAAVLVVVVLYLVGGLAISRTSEKRTLVASGPVGGCLILLFFAATFLIPDRPSLFA